MTLEPDVTLAAEGDRLAFGRLVDATRTTVCSIALSVVQTVEASEDVAQDVYLHAWESLPKLRNASSFLPWLRQLARNRAHNYVRQERPWKRTDLDESLVAHLADTGPGPDARLLVDADRRWIRDALDELSAETREIVILFYREEQSVRQVARLLDMSEVAVKKRLERARRSMRELLERELAERLEGTKPNAAFSFAVLALLPPLAPVTGAATKGLAGYVGASKAVGIFGAAVTGLALVVGGVLMGYYHLAKDAVDDRERREIWTLAGFGAVTLSAVVVAASVAGDGASTITRVFLHLVVIGLLALQQWVLLPRVMARRLAAEVARDPSAAAKHERIRRICKVWFAIGVVAGLAPLVLHLLQTL